MTSNSTAMYRLGDPLGSARVRVNPVATRGTWQLAARAHTTTGGFSTMGHVSIKRTPRPLGDST